MGLGGMAALGPIGQTVFMRQALAAVPQFNDYKALVCIFLQGGNDSQNMFIPLGDSAGTTYDEYAGIRTNLAINNNDLGLTTVAGGQDLNNGFLSPGTGNPYNVDMDHNTAYTKGLYGLKQSKGINLGVNGMMPELAQLITDNKANIIANIGTLVEPVTRAEIRANTANLPLFLFAHDHQNRILRTGQADNLQASGWAGRIADHWSGVNNNSALGLNVAYDTSDRMLVGDNTKPLILSSSNIPQYTGMETNSSNDGQDRRALFKALAGQQNASISGALNFNNSNTFTTSDPFQQLYNNLLSGSMETFDSLKASWNDPMIFNSKGSYGEELFSKVGWSDLGFAADMWTDFFGQLFTVTKMIKLAASGALGTGFNRQIFVVKLGWFDHHDGQTNYHSRVLRYLSMGLWKFQKAMEELGLANQVTTYTMSEFGRTISNNGDGTDHGWGGHHIVMGGDGHRTAGNLNGGQMLGQMPDIRLGGLDDHGYNGRLIPSTSQDQLNASLCRWMGVDDTLMPLIFPNVGNFKTTQNIDSAYLQGLFV